MDEQNQSPTPQAGPTPPPPATHSQTPVQIAPQSNQAPQPVPAGDNNTDSALSGIASGFGAVLGAIFSWIIFPIAVVLILHNFVFQAYHVLGTSMQPTLHNADYLIVSKVGYTEALIGRDVFHQNDSYLPARGEIIVFHYPKDPTKIFVKRVIGLPGDHIVIKNGNVTVYNKEHPGGYNPDAGFEPAGTQTLIDTDEVVQPDNLFVMGDNRTPGGSFDSREWGELPSSYIIGNAVLRLLPLDQVKIL
jgi:signal peptidase I